MKDDQMFSESDQRSWMAVYTKTLVNFLAIPVKIDQKNKTAKFELFSVRTFLSLFLYCGVFLGYALLLILQRHFARDNLMAWFATNQLFECYSAFIFSANVYLANVYLANSPIHYLKVFLPVSRMFLKHFPLKKNI